VQRRSGLYTERVNDQELMNLVPLEYRAEVQRRIDAGMYDLAEFITDSIVRRFEGEQLARRQLHQQAAEIRAQDPEADDARRARIREMIADETARQAARQARAS
jgi:hypothetical protein